jgi:YD repeat-containing protein
VTVTATPDPVQTSTRTFDGLGRLVRLVDPGLATTDTTYDHLDRVASVSNPYIAAGDQTSGFTSYAYDALGRRLLQCQPDNGTGSGPCVAENSYLQWYYNGYVTTFYDERRVSPWVRTSDALGRLTNVVEPGSLQTGYTYDALNNLQSVNQTGISANGEVPRTRSFTYDSLSRLVCASNPENSLNACPASAMSLMPSGVTLYGYVKNGILCAGNVSLPCSKTDARGVTTGYIYDALNRVTSRTYSGQNTVASAIAGTSPSSCYQYDGATNGIGRLAAQWTQPGACPQSLPASSTITWRQIQSYDAVGRMTAEEQCAWAPCASPNSLSYAYDLAGNLAYSTNGLPISATSINPTAPGLAMTYGIDAAGRLNKVTSNWSGSYPATLFEADQVVNGVSPYGPFGLTAAQLGVNSQQQAAMAQIRTYDNRARLTGETTFGSSLIATTVSVTATATSFPLNSPPVTTAHVSCNSACGSVDFSIDGSDLGFFPLNGGGNFVSGVVPNLSVGSHKLTVFYPGNSTYAPSSSIETFTVLP